MAELIGLAGSVAGLADVSLSMYKSLFEFGEAIKSSQGRIRALALDIGQLNSVLIFFQSELDPKKQFADMNSEWKSRVASNIENCRRTLESIDDEFVKICGRPSKGLDGKSKLSWQHRVQWYLKKDKIEMYRADLASAKSTFGLLNGALTLAAVVQTNHKLVSYSEMQRLRFGVELAILEQDEAEKRRMRLQSANVQSQGGTPSGNTGAGDHRGFFTGTAIPPLETHPSTTHPDYQTCVDHLEAFRHSFMMLGHTLQAESPMPTPKQGRPHSPSILCALDEPASVRKHSQEPIIYYYEPDSKLSGYQLELEAISKAINKEKHHRRRGRGDKELMSKLKIKYAEVSRLLREEEQHLEEEEIKKARSKESKWRTDHYRGHEEVVEVEQEEADMDEGPDEKLLTVDDLLQKWTAVSDEGGSDSAEDIESDSSESEGDLQPGHGYLDRPRRPY